jgi:DNA repair protein RadC
MILVHSHPHSATPKPSKLDIETTRIVHEYFLRIGIPVLDHRIYGTGGHVVFSFVQQQVPWSVDQLPDHLALELA